MGSNPTAGKMRFIIPKMLEWSKRNVVHAKILTGLLFLAFAAVIVLL